MNLMEAIGSRRSIRQFEGKAVPRELVEQVLEAAIKAPSAMNLQPWRFVVVEGSECRKLAQVILSACQAMKERGLKMEGVERTAQSMVQAPVAVLVFNAEANNPDSIVSMTDFHQQSIGACVQTLLLAATDLGLASLWCGGPCLCVEEIGKWLGRTEPLAAVVSLGYPSEAPSARSRRPVAEITEWRWGA
ncbi:MAG TPA: nitroreductase family protein [Armatimonadota bacterium]|jgi:nitroreductase